MPFEGGPFLQAACLCNMVIEDKTNTLSLIRIIDNVTHVERGPSPPEDMPPFMHSMKLVLMMKSGRATGRSEIVITPELPSGLKETPMPPLSVHFTGEERGHNQIVNLNFEFKMEGLYWFHIHLDGEPWTSIPFRIRYSRQVLGTS
jgi:hypothetical protein